MNDRVCIAHLPEHITFSINFKENCDARDVVYHSIIFFPLLGTRPHYCVARLLRAILNVVGPDNPGNCLVRKELPDAVARDDDELVGGLEHQLLYLWFPRHSYRVGKAVTQATAHSESWGVLSQHPNTIWSQVLALWPNDRIDTATDFLDTRTLLGQPRLVVFRQWSDLEATFLALSIEDSPRIACVSAVDPQAVEQDRTDG